MPTYEYHCDRCGYRFERFQMMSAAPETSCPECGGAVRRLVGTGSAFLIRGSERGQSPPPQMGRCGHSAPCCGRAERCDEPPCEER